MNADRWTALAWSTFLVGAVVLGAGLVWRFAPAGLPLVLIALGGLVLGVGALFGVVANHKDDCERAERLREFRGGAS